MLMVKPEIDAVCVGMGTNDMAGRYDILSQTT